MVFHHVSKIEGLRNLAHTLRFSTFVFFLPDIEAQLSCMWMVLGASCMTHRQDLSQGSKQGCLGLRIADIPTALVAGWEGLVKHISRYNLYLI